MQRTALATISSALVLAGAAALPTAATATAAPAASLTTLGEVVLVDDDGLQCPGAETSIQAAIQEAPAGAVVQVCPGVYTEFVHIDKPLTLVGQPDAIDALDCFDSAASQADDLDPTRYAILNRPAGVRGNLVTVATGGVTVAGLVLQKALTLEPRSTPNIEDAAIHLQLGSAGASVHHNLIRLNGLGVDLGSDDSAATSTRVDNNCLRDNDFAMASQRQGFVGGTVDHNETFRTRFQAYEVGWPFASTRDSVFASNVSRQDLHGFTVQNSSNVSIVDNDVQPRVFGVLLGGNIPGPQNLPGNENITVTDNRIVDGAPIEGNSLLGVFFTGSDSPSTGLVVSDNHISDFGPVISPQSPGTAIGLGNNANLQGVEILDNKLQNNNIGLSVNPTSSGVVVRDNIVIGNRQQGIFSRASVVVARYEDNRILRNVLDARDDNRAANTWIDNVCQTDSPPGSICGAG